MTLKEFKFKIQYALGLMFVETKLELAENPKTSKKILTILSGDGNADVLYDVRQNPNTPKRIAEIMNKKGIGNLYHQYAYHWNKAPYNDNIGQVILERGVIKKRKIGK